jgi:hypothetical protein
MPVSKYLKPSKSDIGSSSESDGDKEANELIAIAAKMNSDVKSIKSKKSLTSTGKMSNKLTK